MASYEFDASAVRAIRVPVLFLLGTRSPARFRDLATALHEVLAGAQIVELKNQQHFANVIAPTRFTREVEKCLGGLA